MGLQLADMASFIVKKTIRKLKENQSSHRFDEPQIDGWPREFDHWL